MHHTTSKNFHPTGLFADTATFASTNETTDIHFSAGLGKWKIGRTESWLNILAIHFLRKEIKCLFQISETYMLINIQSFHLVKETMRSCTHSFISIYTARANDTDRQFSFFHFTYLHIAGMCS